MANNIIIVNLKNILYRQL